MLLQQRTEDRFRGRVFAVEFLAFNLLNAIAVLAASALLESGILEVRGAIFAFAVLQIAVAFAYFRALRSGGSS